MLDLLDFSDDYLCFDGLTPITYGVRRRAGSPDVDLVASALRRSLSTNEKAASQGAYTAGLLTWHVPQALLADGVTPKPGDTVTDDGGEVYTVLSEGFNVLQSVWRLSTISLKIAHDLRQLLTVETPTIGRDATGAVTRGPWATRYVDVPCRIQPLGEELVTERLAHGPVTRFAAYVDRDLDVKNAAGFDRVTCAGVVYDVKGYHEAERLDGLPVIDLELAV